VVVLGKPSGVSKKEQENRLRSAHCGADQAHPARLANGNLPGRKGP
jgi:hypothetical protein